MQSKVHQKRKTVLLCTSVGIAALGIGLLINAEAVAKGIQNGLSICGNVLIPSLFPFMVLSVFLSITDYARILSIPLAPITKYIFKLPREWGILILLSMVGGYPVGAKMIATALEQGTIDRKTAERMLCFCMNSGPSFLISAVGVGLFRNLTVGVILFATQTFATILIGWLISRKTPVFQQSMQTKRAVSGPAALVTAVQSATASMLTMCAFAVLFCGIVSMIRSGNSIAALASVLPVDQSVLLAIVSGLLEVTSGCIAAVNLEGTVSFALISIMVSLGGLSVIFQIISCFGARPMNFMPFICARVLHAGIATAVALPLYQRFCADITVALALQPPLMYSDHNTTLVSVCLLGMCTIFTLSLGEGLERKQHSPQDLQDLSFFEEKRNKKPFYPKNRSF